MAGGRKGAGSRGGRIVNRKLMKGARKGQTVRGYMTKTGKFKELKTNTRKTAGGQQTRAVGKSGLNKSKGARKGLKFANLRSGSGQKIHRYVINGKIRDIVVKPKKTSRTEQLSIKKPRGKKK